MATTPTVVTNGTREEMLANAQKLAAGIKTSLADSKLTSKQSSSISSQLNTASQKLSTVAKPTNVPTVTADMMQGAQTPIQIQQPPQALDTKGMLGGIQASTDAYTANLEAQRTANESKFNSASSAYQDFLTNLQGSTGLTSDAYSKKGGVDQIQIELNDINQQILEEQAGLQRKIEALEKNPAGMLAGGLADQIDDVERESLRKQADLSIIQMGVQGRYDSAKQIADRAVSAYLEKQSILNDTLKFNYDNAKDLFSKSEQRQFESAQADRERKLNEDRDNMTAIRNLAIQAQQEGAPMSMVQSILNSKTLDEAIGKNTYRKPVTGGGGAPTIKTINGVDYQWNESTGKWEVPTGVGGVSGSPTELKKAGAVNDIDTILQMSNDDYSEMLGKRNIIQRNIPGTEEYQFSVQHDNLMNQLALASRGDLKGQGQVSDYEGKLLKSAQTTLNLYMEPAAYRKELKQVRGAIQTSSGIPTYVKVTPSDGGAPRYAVLDSQSIQEAVNQGYVIEYQ